MKFLLDMGLAQSTARWLRSQEYDNAGALISVTEQAIRIRHLPVR